MTELLVFVFLLAICFLFVLRIVDRKTRVEPEEREGTDLQAAVKRAGDFFARELRNAGAGPLPLAEAVRPLRDNAVDESVRGLDGKAVAVRAGTDQVELRGVLRSSLLRLEPTDQKTGEAFSAPAGSASPGLFQRSPDDARLRIYVTPGRENPPLRATLALLGDLNRGNRTKKAFFLVVDAEGSYAVARILSVDESRHSTGRASPFASDSFAELRLDFTDPDAAALNRGEDAKALSRLGAIAVGGLFDREVFFVARGDQGRPPDFVPGSDPPSLRFPHPYFAAARDVGGSSFEVSRIADDIEDFQVSYATDSGERNGSAPELSVFSVGWVDPLGRSCLSGLRFGLVGKGKERMQPGEAFADAGGRALSLAGRDGVWLLNAPRADLDSSIPGPVGWSAFPSKRVSFVRRFAVIDVAISEAR